MKKALVNSTNYLYGLALDSSKIFRINVTDLSDVAYVTLSPPLPAYDLYLWDIDTERKIGFIPSFLTWNVLVVDLTAMTIIGSFNYLQGSSPFFPYSTPLGNVSAGIVAVDSSLQYLYISSCGTNEGTQFFPSFVWQFDISDVSNITFRNWTTPGYASCFTYTFVSYADHRYWFLDPNMGWAAGWTIRI